MANVEIMAENTETLAVYRCSTLENESKDTIVFHNRGTAVTCRHKSFWGGGRQRERSKGRDGSDKGGSGRDDLVCLFVLSDEMQRRVELG